MHHYIFAGQRQSDGSSKYHCFLLRTIGFKLALQLLALPTPGPAFTYASTVPTSITILQLPKSTIDFIVILGEKLEKHRGKSRLFRHHSFFFYLAMVQGTSCQARSKRWSKKSLRSKEPLHRPGKTGRKQ